MNWFAQVNCVFTFQGSKLITFFFYINRLFQIVKPLNVERTYLGDLLIICNTLNRFGFLSIANYIQKINRSEQKYSKNRINGTPQKWLQFIKSVG